MQHELDYHKPKSGFQWPAIPWRKVAKVSAILAAISLLAWAGFFLYTRITFLKTQAAFMNLRPTPGLTWRGDSGLVRYLRPAGARDERLPDGDREQPYSSDESDVFLGKLIGPRGDRLVYVRIECENSPLAANIRSGFVELIAVVDVFEPGNFWNNLKRKNDDAHGGHRISLPLVPQNVCDVAVFSGSANAANDAMTFQIVVNGVAHLVSCKLDSSGDLVTFSSPAAVLSPAPQQHFYDINIP